MSFRLILGQYESFLFWSCFVEEGFNVIKMRGALSKALVINYETNEIFGWVGIRVGSGFGFWVDLICGGRNLYKEN